MPTTTTQSQKAANASPTPMAATRGLSDPLATRTGFDHAADAVLKTAQAMAILGVFTAGPQATAGLTLMAGPALLAATQAGRATARATQDHPLLQGAATGGVVGLGLSLGAFPLGLLDGEAASASRLRTTPIFGVPSGSVVGAGARVTARAAGRMGPIGAALGTSFAGVGAFQRWLRGHAGASSD